MGLIHTPYVIFSIGKGFWKKQRVSSMNHLVGSSMNNNRKKNQNSSNIVIGIGAANAYWYEGYVALFAVNYLGHLNNAAYLLHCEYAQ
jgi:hypothetical protein